MDHSAWREHIGTLTAILSSSDAGDLPTILFDGRSDWYAPDTDELVESLSRRLSGEQADRLLALVRTGDSGDQRSAVDERPIPFPERTITPTTTRSTSTRSGNGRRGPIGEPSTNALPNKRATNSRRSRRWSTR